MRDLGRVSTRDLKILVQEIRFRFEDGDPLRDDSRRYGDAWRAEYQARVAAYLAELAGRGFPEERR